MTVFGHLSELRRRLIACVVCILVLTGASWNFAGRILDLIMQPVLNLLPSGLGLYYTGLPDAFSVTFRVSLWSGAILSSPFCLYQLWAFIAPGLLPEEKSQVPFLTLLATVLFLAGIAFAYFIAFPMTFTFFLTFSSEAMQPLLTVDRYMSLVMGIIVAFAVSFQLPLFLMFLGRLGLISPDFLRRQRPYAIVLIFIFAAVLTPPDVISQLILASVLILLYELSIFLVKGQQKIRNEALEAEDSQPDPATEKLDAPQSDDLS
jgi:sec-independent protein translocase protein TatC